MLYTFCPPPLADLFIPTPFSASPGSILARQQLRAKTKSLTFLSTERTKMPKLWNGSKGNSNPGCLDCESGILPLSYRTPLRDSQVAGVWWLDVGNLRGFDTGCLKYVILQTALSQAEKECLIFKVKLQIEWGLSRDLIKYWMSLDRLDSRSWIH